MEIENPESVGSEVSAAERPDPCAAAILESPAASDAVSANNLWSQAGGLVLLISVTVLGFLTAFWVRSDWLRNAKPAWWLVNLAAHLSVLGLWTVSWLIFRKYSLLPNLKERAEQQPLQTAAHASQPADPMTAVLTAVDQEQDGPCLAQVASGVESILANRDGRIHEPQTTESPSPPLALRALLPALRSSRLALAVPLLAAAAAELVQRFMPGHVPDLLGFGYNLAGVGGALLLCRSLWRT